jgi:hypothetical protein
MSYYALLIQHYFCFYYPLPSNVSFMSFISQFIEKYLSLFYLCACLTTNTCHDTRSTHFFHLRPQVATLFVAYCTLPLSVFQDSTLKLYLSLPGAEQKIKYYYLALRRRINVHKSEKQTQKLSLNTKPEMIYND